MGKIWIRELGDTALLERTQELVRKEREFTVQVLHHLKEVERRRLFARAGFSSLFEYCVRELGYSEAAAQRRISSMRLLKEMPEVQEQVENGKLSLSVLTQAQRFFRQESERNRPLALDEKQTVLKALEGKTAREAERELIARSSAPITDQFRESLRPLGDSHSELRVMLSEGTIRDLEKVRGLLANSVDLNSWAALIERVTQIALSQLDPARSPRRKRILTEDALPTQKPTASVGGGQRPVRPRVRAAQRREVWKRDGGRCTYVNPATRKRCASVRGLQIDHCVPLGKGGEHVTENMRLYCSTHNQYAADQAFGRDFMESKRERAQTGEEPKADPVVAPAA